ncbi:MAG: transketolase [Planctomycetota bacterium]|jgi:transketolase|nr:transketolase [Planctomycetota bacterium]
MDLRELRGKAVGIRRDLLNMIYKAKAGHTGGSLSSTDILTALYYDALRVDPANPHWRDRDYFVLSKGHSVEGLFCILADKGFFDKAELNTFCRFGTRLIGHPNNRIPGVEMNTGALGHGLSISTGMAKGLKMSRRSNRVYTLMGDGELAEGSIWEAAMAASHYKLDNLTAIIDRNRLQISGDTETVMAQEPLADRWRAFGWQVVQLDGHDMAALVAEFRREPARDKPRAIIARTVKGKGVREMENLPRWHHGVPDAELLASAMRQLDAQERSA